MVDFKRINAMDDPRRYRLSDNFMLSDFLGNHSVYSKGLKNSFEFDEFSEAKILNAIALCESILEPLMAQFGPLSVGYGYIAPDVSRALVKYQDPAKPSHHRWDLGAAADVILHKWVAGEFPTAMDLYVPESAVGAPITLAHAIDYLDLPYSRMITYSESPYLCLAAAFRETSMGTPRKAFYENRYMGVKKSKPDYRQYGSPMAKQKALESLQNDGLKLDWQGAGYPTYHGGGFRQLHHTRVSKYTMVSDWLFDLKSISNGAKNVPCMNLDSVQDSFAAAGIVYDWMIESIGVPRLSIAEGYVSHTNPSHNECNDWRGNKICFVVSLPQGFLVPDHIKHLSKVAPEGVTFRQGGPFINVLLDVNTVLTPGVFL